MLVETIVKPNGESVEIYYDEHSENPRNWDNISKMYCFHKRYNLGDKHKIDHTNYSSFDEMIEDNTSPDDIVYPLYMYEHGGIEISTTPFSCRWDSGQLGFIVVTKETIIKEYGSDTPDNRERALRVMLGEVATYADYVDGRVFYYKLKDVNGETIDCIGGFYGYDHAESGLYESAGIDKKQIA